MAPKVFESETVVNSEPKARTVEAPPEPDTAPPKEEKNQPGESQRSSQTTPEQEGPKKPAPWQRPGFRKLMFFGAIVLVIVGVFLFLHYRNRESTDDAQVDAHLAPISARVAGTVVAVLVNDNQRVKAGDVLVKIDPRDYQARVDQVKAALSLAEAQARGADVNVPLARETTQSGSSSASADLQSAQAAEQSAEVAYQKANSSDLAYARAEVDKQQATLTKAHNDLERMRPLVAKAEISQQQFDGYVAANSVAQGEVDAAKQKVAQAEQSVAMARDQVESAKAKVAQAQAGVTQAQANEKQVTVRQATAEGAKAQIAQAQANLDAANLDLSYAIVVAPIDGVVTDRAVQVGQVLAPGQALMVIVPLNDVWVTANFKETQLAKVRQGEKAEIHVDMYGETFTGHVDSIAGATGSRLSLLPPENATGNFVKVVQRIPVKILLDPIPPDKAILRPGMNVDAVIFTR
jgi:membrane fusion protein (multidrug efflux system)